MIVVEPPRKPEFQVLREYMKNRYGKPVLDDVKEASDE